jgi:phage terminase large subunit-like protein
VSVFIVPPMEDEPWPSLGGQVCAWIETNLVHGPGDLLGKPVQMDDEKRALIFRAYEVYPRHHELAGRRRFQRVCVSLRKGSAKTEWAAWIAAAELSPTGPVRTVDWNGDEPIGGPVTDPYIPMVAYTEEQTEELAYGALRLILEHSPLAGEFDIGLERIVRSDGTGKAVALASSPDARDGARTTFAHSDETHRFKLPRLRKAHRTMLANLPKRKAADAWALETTTAPAPGEHSVAEDTMAYARSVADGLAEDASLFFFHRQADDDCDLTTRDAIRAAVLEASGPIAAWSNIEAIVKQWDDPTADQAYLRRVWLNQEVRSADRAFDVKRWAELTKPEIRLQPGELIALGFDGARRRDSTALVGTSVLTGHQEVLGLWERPLTLKPGDAWEVPDAEVHAAVASAFERFNVWRMYADPPYWETACDEWAAKYVDRVVLFYTKSYGKMAEAVRGFKNAIADGHVSHDGNKAFARHIANAYRMPVSTRDAELFVITKERSDSPNKVDVGVAAVLSWEARGDAIKLGVGTPPKASIYETRGLLTL